MCWPHLEGDIEIEERYPRTNDPREPRRKRLNFVRERGSSSKRRSSDDWALMRSPFNQARPIRREMQEIHDPRLLQQQAHQYQMLLGHSQQLQQQLGWTDDRRRRLEIEQAQHHQQNQRHELENHGHHGHPPPPPPPPAIGHHPHVPGLIQPAHNSHAHGAEVDEEYRPHHAPSPRMIEVAPRTRSHMPSHVRHRSPLRGRSQRRNHSGPSVYSAEHEHDHHRRRQRSPTVYGSSTDSFDNLLYADRYR